MLENTRCFGHDSSWMASSVHSEDLRDAPVTAHDADDSTVSGVWNPEREERARLREMARSHEKRNDWDALAQVLARLCVVAADDDRPDVHKWLAHVRDNFLNDALGAVRALEAAVDIVPTDDDSWDRLVVLYDRLGDVRRMEKALQARFRSPTPASGTLPVNVRVSTLVSPGELDQRSTRQSMGSISEGSPTANLALLEPHTLSSPMTVAFERLAQLFCTVAGSIEEESNGSLEIPGTGNSVRRMFEEAAAFVGVGEVQVDMEMTSGVACTLVVSEIPRVRVDPCSFVESDAAARFAAAAYIARLSPRLRASAFFPSPGRLRVLLAWPQRAAPEARGTVPDLGNMDLMQASAPIEADLREVYAKHGSWMNQVSDMDLYTWLIATRVAEVRAGVVFAGSCEAAIAAIERGLWLPAPLTATQAIHEAKTFAASELFAHVKV